MDVEQACFADEDTINKHVDLFKEKFVECFRHKWQKYQKMLAKVKLMEQKTRTITTDNVSPDQPETTDDVDGTTANVSEEHPNDQTGAEEPRPEHDDANINPSTNTEDGYIDTFLLTLRRKKVRRVISSSHNLCEDLLYEMVAEAGEQLAVTYEYQLSMLAGEAQVERAACYAVQCIITSLQSRDSSFDSESLVVAVLDISPSNMTLKRTKLKTRIPKENGVLSDCVYWTVHGFFHKPGLRILKRNADAEREDRQFEHIGCFSPWGSKCVPEVYGFRGPLYFRRHESNIWEMVYNDKASVHKHQSQTSVPERHIDAKREFHKSYKPLYISRHNLVEV